MCTVRIQIRVNSNVEFIGKKKNSNSEIENWKILGEFFSIVFLAKIILGQKFFAQNVEHQNFLSDFWVFNSWEFPEKILLGDCY